MEAITRLRGLVAFTGSMCRLCYPNDVVLMKLAVWSFCWGDAQPACATEGVFNRVLSGACGTRKQEFPAENFGILLLSIPGTKVDISEQF